MSWSLPSFSYWEKNYFQIKICHCQMCLTMYSLEEFWTKSNHRPKREHRWDREWYWPKPWYSLRSAILDCIRGVAIVPLLWPILYWNLPATPCSRANRADRIVPPIAVHRDIYSPRIVRTVKLVANCRYLCHRRVFAMKFSNWTRCLPTLWMNCL